MRTQILDILKRLKAPQLEPELYHLKSDEFLSNLKLTYGKGATFVEAGTGLGKTYEALSYENKTKHINLSVPLISMLHNKSKQGVDTYWEHGMKGYGYASGIPCPHAESAMIGKTTMGTYDSIARMSTNLMNDTICFYDEFTYASMSQGFRDRVAPQYQRLMDKAWAMVMMSGTVYRDAVMPFVDRYVIVDKDGSQKREATIIANEEGMGKVGFITSSIEKAYNENGFVVAFVESKEDIKTLKDILKIPEDEIISFVSGESDHTVSNTAEANEMIKSGVIPKGKRVLLWTSAAIVGADLRHEEGNIPVKVFFHSNYDASPEAIAQMCGRFRDANVVECFIGCSVDWYDRHFRESKGYDHELMVRQLIQILKDGADYYEDLKTFKGFEHKHLFLEDKVNILGVMEWITQQIKRYSDWNMLYSDFNIEIVNVVNANRKIPEHLRADFIEVETALLAMYEEIDYEEVEKALDEDTDEKIQKLPLEIQQLIELSGSAGISAGGRLTNVVSVKSMYRDPNQWRLDHVRGDTFPALSGMIEKPKTSLDKWSSTKRLRRECLAVLGHSKYHKKEVIVNAISKMRVGKGRLFLNSKNKKVLLDKLKKPNSKVSQLLPFLSMDMKKQGADNTKVYRLNLGLPEYTKDYKVEFVENRFEPFYKDDGFTARCDYHITDFECLESAKKS